MGSARHGLGRRFALALGVTAALLVSAGAALAQVPPAPSTPPLPEPPPGVIPRVPPPGVVPSPPPVPPPSLPPDAESAAEAASVPAAFVCSVPGGITSILRFGLAAAGLTSTVDADGATPWFGPLYSACLAVPVPMNPTQCEADRMLRAEGYGPNGLPITIYFPDPVGAAVTPVEVAEREAAAHGATLPVSAASTAGGQLGCEKLQPVGGADVAGELPDAPRLPAPAVGTAAVGVAGVTDQGGAVGGGSTTAGPIASTAGTGALGLAGTAAPAAVGSAATDASGTTLAARPAVAASVGGAEAESPLKRFFTALAVVIGVALAAGFLASRRGTAPAAPPGR